MSASITFSKLALSTPEGHPLLANINVSFGPERTGLVGRNGVGKTTLLRLIAGELSAQSGTVSVSGTLGFLRQAVQVIPDETVADLFEITAALALLRRAEQGEASAEQLAEADWTLQARLASALSRAGLDVPPETPLAVLSGGQRTRAGLAALVFAEPDFLLLDEPTNNLDREGRRAVIDLLASWPAGAIVVSHDRELLDTMDAIVELTSLGAARYGGNWSVYREHKALELASARHDLAESEKRIADIDNRARIAAERKARKDGTGRRKAAQGGMPRIVLGGLKERSENTGGGAARLVESRRTQAAAAVAAARQRIEILQPLSVVLPPTGLPARKMVLSVDAVTAGYEPDRPIIRDLSFTITGPERMAVTGPNGSGKTTLLALLAGKLEPWTGAVRIMTGFALLDQQVSLLDPRASIRDNFRRLNPQADENACRASLARFMFRADAALQAVSSLSGGQLLRAALACVLGGEIPPPLLILDEPTNHLDIESIETIEAGLRAFDGALLVVSHDETFLASLQISLRIDMATENIVKRPAR